MRDERRMTTSIRYTGLLMIAMLAALALITGYWQAARGPSLATREDNPRLVLAEQQIPRGAILDRNGHPLAASQNSENGYVRYYPEPAAEPVVGYYGLRYGVGGAEAAFDDELRGTAGRTRLNAFVDGLLHRVPAGRLVRLTLDLSAQRAADAALANHAGAVVVLSAPEGEVIALASHPTFNPATLDDDWERLRADAASPLLNRATQGLYQPGAAFQTILLAEAMTRGLAHLTDTIPSAHAPVAVGDATLQCATSPAGETLAAAFAAGCPAPFAQLADQFDAPRLVEMIHRWKLDTAPDQLGLPAHASLFAPDSLTSTQAVRDLVLGQGALTVSPLQMASVIGAIANDGRPLTVRLTPGPSSLAAPPILSSEIAGAVRAALPTSGELAGQTALAVSGEKQHAWFIGFAPSSSPRWVIVVLLEQENAATAHQIAAQVSATLMAR
jgi:peptidoglycan glycosyltransferase